MLAARLRWSFGPIVISTAHVLGRLIYIIVANALFSAVVYCSIETQPETGLVVYHHSVQLRHAIEPGSVVHLSTQPTWADVYAGCVNTVLYMHASGGLNDGWLP
ncbi:uncharacterized protein OE_5290R (plasmid) [Halobacterium salinarum R1]|uniref:Uncharacterized protein n=1 Tax=Halobacterium salinarum (strain ATCC 29341 / DSM 671 / R1) TaxID=478009 RepID=B0RA15_HALS3|nr:uncharacterized protein OE_5290R [Halobacterium salinarum R1]